jgi:hypothetical protein
MSNPNREVLMFGTELVSSTVEGYKFWPPKEEPRDSGLEKEVVGRR